LITSYKKRPTRKERDFHRKEEGEGLEEETSKKIIRGIVGGIKIGNESGLIEIGWRNEANSLMNGGRRRRWMRRIREKRQRRNGGKCLFIFSGGNTL